MILYRPDADTASAGNLFVQKTLAHMIQDILFAGGQARQSLRFLAGSRESKQALKVVPDSKKDFLRRKNSLAQRDPNRLKQFRRLSAPKDVTGGDTTECNEDLVAVLINPILEGGKVRQ